MVLFLVNDNNPDMCIYTVYKHLMMFVFIIQYLAVYLQ